MSSQWWLPASGTELALHVGPVRPNGLSNWEHEETGPQMLHNVSQGHTVGMQGPGGRRPVPGTVIGFSGEFYSERQRLLKALWDSPSRVHLSGSCLCQS